jgi:hypothetical protein
MLLEVVKCKRMVYLSRSPTGETRMMLAPTLVAMREPSKYMVQYLWRVCGGRV